MLYQAMGEYQKALPLLEQARDRYKKLLTENHPNYAQSLNNLAILYQAMGEYRKALPLLEQARDLRKKRLTKNHPDYGESLNNLALLYWDMGKYQEAVPLFEQARDLFKKLLTENHPDYGDSLNNLYGDSLNNLARLYRDMGEYKKALSLYEQARDLYKKLRTENHPDYATSLNNLAVLYQDMGEYQKALALYEQARDLFKKLLTEDHPHYAQSLNDLGFLYYGLKKPEQAAPLFRQALNIKKRFLEDTFAAQSERQRLALLEQYKDSLFAFLSVSPHAGVPPADIYSQVLPWKAALCARQAEEQTARHQPQLQPLAEELRRLRAGLAKVARQVPTDARQRADWRKRFDDLEKDKEKLEVRLAQESHLFRRFRKLRNATAKDVADALPPRTAFIDFLAYEHYTPSAKGKGKFLTNWKLLAFVLAKGRKPVLAELGSLAAINDQVRAWRQAVSRNQPPAKLGRKLARILWQPLRKQLKDVEAVLIAPDWLLCGLPFAALPGTKPGTYLIEEVAIGYVTSGRHLLELNADKDAPRGQGLLTVGGLAYGKPPAKGDKRAVFAGLAFGALPGTQLEVDCIAQLYRQAFPKAEPARQLTGSTADAARLKKELPPVAKVCPRFLHLATHGFFEEPTPTGPAKGRSRFPNLDRVQRTYVRNPLLLSGLVLAGANASYDKGILTAEEVRTLDLRRVDLAVLSACETGLGKATAGEGMLGLLRGFQIAGARTLAVSLWSVNDAATSVLMEEFYQNLWVKKQPKLQALRAAQLTVLRNPHLVEKRRKELAVRLAKGGVSQEELDRRGIGKKARELPRRVVKPGRSPPALWAGFVLCGDSR
jgi:CHAT domain-containing protein